MTYLTVREAAEQWGVTPRQVQRLLTAGRIPGAERHGRGWLIPGEAQKPEDPRRVGKMAEGAGRFHFAYAMPLSKLDTNDEPPAQYRALYAADRAYRRGDPEPAKAYWRAMEDGDETLVSAATLTVAAAVVSGDFGLYDEIRERLKAVKRGTQNQRDRALLTLPETMMTVAMAAPALTPEWLVDCDFSRFPKSAYPFLLYCNCLHLRNTGNWSALLAAARTAALMIYEENTFTWLDVNLSLLCAVACQGLQRREQARGYVREAVRLGIPAGFYTLFADLLSLLGGLVEACIQERYPEALAPVTDLWKISFLNWMRFHNRFTRDNVTTILTPQEYQAARLLSRGVTYAEAGRRLNLPARRVKELQTAIFSKLQVSNRKELKQFIL